MPSDDRNEAPSGRPTRRSVLAAACGVGVGTVPLDVRPARAADDGGTATAADRSPTAVDATATERPATETGTAATGTATDRTTDDGSSGDETRTVDDFSDGDLSAYRVEAGDPAVTTIDDATVLELGARAAAFSTDGLPNYPVRGDRSEFRLHFRGVADGGRRSIAMAFGVQDPENYYAVGVSEDPGGLVLGRVEGGEWTDVDETSTPMPKSEWLRVLVDWHDGGIVGRVRDADCNDVARASTGDDAWDAGGVGWLSGGPGERPAYVAYAAVTGTAERHPRSVVDDFSDADLAEYVTESGSPATGQYDDLSALELSAGDELYSWRGLDREPLTIYPRRGQVFGFAVHPGDGGDERDLGVAFGVQDAANYYTAWIGRGDDAVRIERTVDGASTVLTSESVELPTDRWLVGVVQWGAERLTLRVFTPDESELVAVSAGDDTWDAGGIGWRAEDDGTGPSYVGFAVITADAARVSYPSPVGDGDLPTDPDGDGLYEDVNGNARQDVADAVDLFRYRGDVDPTFFDFNDSGEVEIGDAVKLFRENAG